MKMQNVILVALIAITASIALAEEIRITDCFSWSAITDPGLIVIAEPTLSDPPGFVHEVADTPLTDLGAGGLTAHEAMTGSGRAELQERNRAIAREEYPPVLLLNIVVPPSADEAERVIVEVELPYEGETDMTKCVQLIPFALDAPMPTASSTVQDVSAQLDYRYTTSATPDPDGVFRFDMTANIPLIEDRTMGNKFVLRPFKSRDSFDVSSIVDRPFAIVMTDEE